MSSFAPGMTISPPQIGDPTMTRAIPVVLVALSLAGAVSAQEMEKPIRFTGIVTTCETWNCAAAALVMADGDKHVIVLPTGRTSQPWVILRRVEEGSIFI